MDRDASLALLRREYETEAREQLGKVQRAVLDWEAAASPEARARQLEIARREAHNMKGAAGSLGLDDLARILHTIESALDRLGDSPDDVTCEDEVLHAVDVIDASLALLGVENDEARLGLLMPAHRRLERFLSGEGVEGAHAADEPGERQRHDSVRVSSNALDEMMAWVDDLLLVRQGLGSVGRELHHLQNRLYEELKDTERQKLRRVGLLFDALEVRLRESDRQMTVLSRELRERLLDLRLFPLADAFEPLRRTARDVARARGRQVKLVLEPGAIRVDRAVLDLLRSPLIHMVRNAIDHGIEDPPERRAAGKTEGALVTVRGERIGPRLRISVADDGRGIDIERVRRRAAETGIVTAEQAQSMSAAEVQRLLFRSGMTLAKQVDEISGRGVGLDGVLAAVHKGQGTVGVSSTLGAGTTFTIELPVWLTSSRNLRVVESERTYAIPLVMVHSIQQRRPNELVWLHRRPWIRDGRRHLPAGQLESLLLGKGPGEIRFRNDSCTFVVLQVGNLRGAVAVGEVVGDEDLVVKDMGAILSSLHGISGGTVDSEGRVVPVLDAPTLLAGIEQPGDAPVVRQRVLVVADDVAATRRLVAQTLESAGFAVIAVPDARAVLKAVEEHDVALAIVDVRMPDIDGLELCGLLRARGQRIPVILMSAAEESEMKEAAFSAGAAAFLHKGTFDPDTLIEIVRQHS